MNQRLRTSLIVLALFVCAWVPRAVALDTFVTVDESKWLTRSANFYEAITKHDFANTFQREHPGVTVMWAGTLGMLQMLPDYPQLAPGYFKWGESGFADWLTANTKLTPLELLVAMRRWVVIALALLTTVAFFPLRRLIGEVPAIASVLFLAWMPWNLALSRLLHPDGLVSTLSFLALTFLLVWLYEKRRTRDLIVSGFIMGLAWLTKTPAAFLVPTGAILVGVELWSTVRGKRSSTSNVRPSQSWRALLAGYVAWGIVATVTFFVLWPAMWINPFDTLEQIAVQMNNYVGGHLNGNFFMGRYVEDPGVFFYPVAYYFRSTPATVIGLLAAILAAIWRVGPFRHRLVRQTAFGMVVFALVFLVGMTIPAKKFDRYLLPSFLALDVVAALGWVTVAGLAATWIRRAQSKRTGGPRYVGAVVTLVLVVALLPLHAGYALLSFPYYLTYYNPLAGGADVASKVMFVGWGEGLDQAAAWLNRQPDAAQRRVLTTYALGSFSFFFDGATLDVSGTTLPLDRTDYVVLYANQMQRQSQPKSIQYLFAEQPVHVVNIGGLELARIYDMDAILRAHTDRERALDTLPVSTEWPGLRIDKLRTWNDVPIGDMLPVDLNLSGRVDGSLKLSVRLVDAAGSKITQQDLPASADMQIPLFVPPEAVPGDYSLQFVVYDAETQDVLQDSNGQDTTTVTTIHVKDPAGSHDP